MSRFNLPPGAVLIDDPVRPPEQVEPVTQLPTGAIPLAPEDPVETAPVAPMEAQEPGYLDRVGGLLERRIDRVQRGSERYQQGEIGYPELATYGFANAFGALADVVGETAFSVLGMMLPDEAEDFLKQSIAAGGNALMDTETAKAGLEFYESLDQRQKDALSNAFDIGLGALPTTKLGNPLLTSAVNADKAKISRFVLDQSSSARTARLAEGGLPKRQQRTLNYEDQLLNTVISLGIKGSDKPTKIISELNREIARLTTDINKGLKSVKTVVPKQTVLARMDADLQAFIKSNPEFADVKKLQQVVKQAQTAFQSSLKQYDGTAVGLLNLRKDFDKTLNKIFARDIFQGENVSREVAAVFRSGLNDMAQELAPNEAIRSSLRRQHLALEARSNVSANLAKSPEKNLVQKSLDVVERHPFAVAAAAQGGGMFTKLPEPLVLGATTALGAYGLSQPGVRRLAGETLNTLPIGRGLLYGAINDFQNQTEEAPQ